MNLLKIFSCAIFLTPFFGSQLSAQENSSPHFVLQLEKVWGRPRVAEDMMANVIYSKDTYRRVMAFSGDSKLLAIGGNYLTVYNTKTGSPVLEWESQIESIAFSPDGKLLATGTWNNFVELWDATKGKFLTKWNVDKAECFGSIIHVSFSPDGKHVGAISKSDRMVVWDLKNFQVVWENSTTGPKCPFSFILDTASFSSDWKYVVSCGIGYTKLRERETQKIIWSNSITTYQLRFTAAQNQIIAAYQDKIFFLDTLTGKTIKTSDMSKAGRVKNDRRTFNVSPIGNKIIASTGLSQEKLVLLDTKTDTELPFDSGLYGPIQVLALSANERFVAAADEYAVRIVAVEPKTTIKARNKYLQTRAITALAVSEDGESVISASLDGSVFVRNSETGQLTRIMGSKKFLLSAAGFTKHGVYAALVDNINYVSEDAGEPAIAFYDTTTGRKVRRLRNNGVPFVRILFNDKIAVLFTGEDQCESVNLHTGAVLRNANECDGRVGAVSQTGNIFLGGGRIAEGFETMPHEPGRVGFVAKYDDRLEQYLYRKNTTALTAMALSNDEKSLVIGHYPGTISWLDAQTGREQWSRCACTGKKKSFVKKRCPGMFILNDEEKNAQVKWNCGTCDDNHQYIRAIALSRQNSTLAVLCQDDYIRLWASDGNYLSKLRFEEDYGVPVSMAYSKEGDHLFVGTDRGFVVKLGILDQNLARF